MTRVLEGRQTPTLTSTSMTRTWELRPRLFRQEDPDWSSAFALGELLVCSWSWKCCSVLRLALTSCGRSRSSLLKRATALPDCFVLFSFLPLFFLFCGKKASSTRFFPWCLPASRLLTLTPLFSSWNGDPDNWNGGQPGDGKIQVCIAPILAPNCLAM